jgi:hypothetical protein
VNIQITASASTVPTKTYKTNQNLSEIRANQAKNILIKEFRTITNANEDKIAPKIKYTIDAKVTGPSYQNDANSSKVVYEKYQYVFLKITN